MSVDYSSGWLFDDLAKVARRKGQHRKPRERAHNFIDLTGKQICEWTVLHRSPRPIRKIVYWRCRCSCGDEYDVAAANLLAAMSGSQKGSRNCKRCARHRKKHHSWNGHEEISGTAWNAIKASGKKRKIEFAITIEYAWDLFVSQNRRCALSGLPICFARSCADQFKGMTTASLDRIDSSLAYVVGNVQWLHKDVNRIKTNMPEDRFIELCCLVAGWQRAKK